jgi:hypothetical protein
VAQESFDEGLMLERRVYWMAHEWRALAMVRKREHEFWNGTDFV